MAGLELKIARLRSGLRAYELARRIGITEAAMSRIETGRQRPTAEVEARILEVLSTAGSPANKVPA